VRNTERHVNRKKSSIATPTRSPALPYPIDSSGILQHTSDNRSAYGHKSYFGFSFFASDTSAYAFLGSNPKTLAKNTAGITLTFMLYTPTLLLYSRRAMAILFSVPAI